MTDTPLTHPEALEHLAAYLDETLSPDDRARVAAHLEGCAICRSVVEGSEEGIELTGVAGFDADALRRQVRRTMLRMTASAAGLVLVGLLIVAILSTLVVQPLLVTALGRADTLARATYVIGPLVQPGVVVNGFSIDSGLADRRFTADLAIPVGSRLEPVGSVSSRLTLRGVGAATLWPFADGVYVNPAPAREVLGYLGAGSVATVVVRFPAVLDPTRAQALLDDPGADVSVVWAGFVVEADETRALRVLGAPTCSREVLPEGFFSASSADAGSMFGSAAPSVRRAFEWVRASVLDLADHPAVLGTLPENWDGEITGIADTLRELDEAPIESMVVTGPASEVLAFMEATDADGSVLASDVYNWTGPICRTAG